MSENPSSIGAAPLAATEGAGRVDALDPSSIDDVGVTGANDDPLHGQGATSSGTGAFRRLLRTPLGMTAISADVILILLAIFAPIIWGTEAMTNDLANINAGPSAEHWFGTDNLGRDILARVLVATRLSLGLALAATAIGLFVGVILGTMPSVLGRRLGRFFTSAVNIAVAFPGLLLALFFAIIFGAGPTGAVFALGLATAPGFARLTQTLAASVAGRDFVAAARTLGIGRFRILSRHLMPNMAEPLIVNGTLGAGGALLAFAALSFLGLGVQLPSYDWGRLLGEGLNKIYINPMAALAPGLAVLLAGLAFNLTGEASAQLAGRRVGRSAKAGQRLRSTVAKAIDPTTAAPATPASVSAVRSAAEPVLDVADLTVSFPVGKADFISPVRGVSLRLERGESVGIVGESGSGKSLTALAIAQLTDPARGGQRPPSAVRGDGAANRLPGRAACVARHLHGDGVPGPDELAEPDQEGRKAVGRGGDRTPGRVQVGGVVEGGGQTAGRQDPRRHPPGQAVPIRVLRRDAAAGDDRDGSDGQPVAADRRRADDRPGRHRAAAGPSAHGPGQGRVRRQPAADLARRIGDRVGLRPGRGDVRREGGGGTHRRVVAGRTRRTPTPGRC